MLPTKETGRTTITCGSLAQRFGKQYGALVPSGEMTVELERQQVRWEARKEEVTRLKAKMELSNRCERNVSNLFPNFACNGLVVLCYAPINW